MAKKHERKEPESKRAHMQSRFTRESLMGKHLYEEHMWTGSEIAVLPDVDLVFIGGRSIMDRGREAILQVVDEIIRCREQLGYRMILGVSGGVRNRHTWYQGIDFGLPIGGLAMLAGAVEGQYARMLYALLAKHGGMWMAREHFDKLPLYVYSDMIPISIATPPYHFWEKPSRIGNIPEYGSDFGMYITAELLGLRRLVFAKDVKGLYTKDPKKHPGKAEFIPRISAQELLEMDLDDLPVHRTVLYNMCRAHSAKELYLVNGLEKGNIEKALAGENVGTVIYKDETGARQKAS
ncbi:MAG: uridine kinase [Candidatus Glassbacteria bacterium]|nr:uridine kinase [Candidatus Glassbacteria bacterium]